MTLSRVPVRRGLALFCFLGIIAFRIDRQLIQLPFMRLTALRQAFADRPDRGWQEYRRFLEGVAAHTVGGDSILIIVANGWDQGYSYAYYRASYLLPGREVIPLILADNKVRLENLHAARYVAAWNCPVRLRAQPVWEGHGGVLMKH